MEAILMFILLALSSRKKSIGCGGTGCQPLKPRPAWAKNPKTGECCGCHKTNCNGWCK